MPSVLPEPRRNWAMFLDIDGTLLDLAPTPRAVRVPPGLPALLSDLGQALDGAVALISGRALSDIDRLFPSLTLVAAGQHGAELRRPDGTVDRCAPPPSDLSARIAAFAADRPGLLVEDKGMTVAVHWRQAPEYGETLGRFVDSVVSELGGAFQAIRGNRVFEIKPRAASKRTAVERLMASPPFAGRIPVFLGDDRTDEDGFAAALAMDGFAIRVGDGEPTIAPLRVAGPAEVHAFLSRIVETLRENAK